jgi:hypothetical protein
MPRHTPWVIPASVLERMHYAPWVSGTVSGKAGSHGYSAITLNNAEFHVNMKLPKQMGQVERLLTSLKFLHSHIVGQVLSHHQTWNSVCLSLEWPNLRVTAIQAKEAHSPLWPQWKEVILVPRKLRVSTIRMAERNTRAWIDLNSKHPECNLVCPDGWDMNIIPLDFTALRIDAE